MGVARFVLKCSVVALSVVGAADVALTDERIMLRGGAETVGSSAVFTLDTRAGLRRIVVRTAQAGVAGSRIEVTVDKAKKPVFSHIFTMEECRFGDNGSRCETVLPASVPAFAAILSQFERGREGHIKVSDAGVMLLDLTASLRGFARAVSHAGRQN